MILNHITVKQLKLYPRVGAGNTWLGYNLYHTLLQLVSVLVKIYYCIVPILVDFSVYLLTMINTTECLIYFLSPSSAALML